MAIGLPLATLGIVALVAGADLVFTSTFAEESQRSEEYGPFGLFGESESRSQSVNLAPIVGLVLLVGGLAGAVTGFVMTHRSFERGKDRELETEEHS